MNWARSATAFLLCVLFTACGVSPRVRVEPVAGQKGVVRPVEPSPRSAEDAHVVVRGDTLYSIAFRNGLDVRDLIAWNALQAPYTIYPGQSLRLHAHKTLSESIRPSAQPTNASLSSQPPVVASGATSKVLGTQAVVDDSQPARVEALSSTETGEPPVVVRAPPPLPTRAPPAAVAQTRTTGALASAIGVPAQPSLPPQPVDAVSAPGRTTASVTVAASSSQRPAPLTSEAPASTVTAPNASNRSTDSKPAPTPAAVAIDSSAATALREGVRWRWPSAGVLLGRFVAGDPTQQGIDIGGKLGQPIVAVADGEVVYSGNGLLGYGEMIIVQHSPDYLSAYGHNQRRLAAEGTKVKAGQVIAEMGQRGSQVMLHFEVRRRGKPVDPLSYLPAR